MSAYQKFPGTVGTTRVWTFFTIHTEYGWRQGAPASDKIVYPRKIGNQEGNLDARLEIQKCILTIIIFFIF